MFCLKCGTDNAEGQIYCVACGKRLPDSSLLTIMKTPNIEEGLLSELQHLFSDFKEGNVSSEEFIGALEGHYAHFENIYANIKEIAQEDDYESYSPDEMNSGYRGIELWMEGLAFLHEYAQVLDESIADAAMQKIKEGNDCINKAVYYNELKRDTEGSSGYL